MIRMRCDKESKDHTSKTPRDFKHVQSASSYRCSSRAWVVRIGLRVVLVVRVRVHDLLHRADGDIDNASGALEVARNHRFDSFVRVLPIPRAGEGVLLAGGLPHVDGVPCGGVSVHGPMQRGESELTGNVALREPAEIVAVEVFPSTERREADLLRRARRDAHAGSQVRLFAVRGARIHTHQEERMFAVADARGRDDVFVHNKFGGLYLAIAVKSTRVPGFAACAVLRNTDVT